MKVLLRMSTTSAKKTASAAPVFWYNAARRPTPPEIEEAKKYSVKDVIKAMAMASTMSHSESGEAFLDDDLWDLTRKTPFY